MARNVLFPFLLNVLIEIQVQFPVNNSPGLPDDVIQRPFSFLTDTLNDPTVHAEIGAVDEACQGTRDEGDERGDIVIVPSVPLPPSTP